MDLTNFGVEVKDDKPKENTDKNLDFNFTDSKKDYSFVEIERFLPWFLKYQLKSFDDLVITNEIKKILNFLEKPQKNKGLLLHGPAGSGKTTTVNLIGNHFKYEVYELNASDNRNKKSILESVGQVIKQKSLFDKNKLVLIDEVDGVSGKDDRGGVAELAKIIKESPYPMIFTANDIENDKIKTLKKTCILIDFVNNSKELLLGIARRIFENENIKFDENELLDFVDIRNTSDIRGFINDLQASVIEGKFILNKELELRDYKKKIEMLLDKIYYSYPEDSLKGSYNTDLNLDDLFLYLEENTPNVYAKNALVHAFNEISKADAFRGRIRKWQYWRYLVYINFYLTYGVSTFKTEPKKTIYKQNQRILKKWIYGNKVNALRPKTKAEKKSGVEDRFVEKLAKLYSRSAKRCRSQDLFYFALQYKNDEEFAKEMDKKLAIDDATKKALMEL